MNKEYDHMALLYAAARYAYERKYGKLMSWIEEKYFQNSRFPSEYYLYADDFIYRMDVTELTYGAVLELAYRALVNGDNRQFLLGIKIVYAKLKGNQRYTYYDRDRILELAMEMWEHYEFEPLQIDEVKIPKLLLDQCNTYLPIGFEEMGLKEYRLSSTRSFYDSYPTVPDKLFEKEYHTAIEQGNIYHHIIEIDHYINRGNNVVTKSQWIHLAKLLSAHYATEKAPWSVDLTKDLLRVYLGLKDCCGQEEFSGILSRMVTATLKIALEKIMRLQEQSSPKELPNVLNYLINVYVLGGDNKFLDYIRELVKVMKREDATEEFIGIKDWLMEQK
ncbi:MAG TPA: hypothetical protein GXX75_10000 [Clostridiales bacterium]|nr:hypothetical protein [Clostridiales bacterium]